MFTWAFDPVHAAAVMVFSGTSNSDRDFEEYLRVLGRLDGLAAERESAVVILVADPENPIPNATWRKRIADATAEVRTKNALFVMVSASAIARGVVTAINWIRKPPYDVGTVATFDEAIDLCEARGKARPPAILRGLLAEARENARNPPSSSKRGRQPAS
jgi:hypothetical protein